jgi:hypothetical protein
MAEKPLHGSSEFGVLTALDATPVACPVNVKALGDLRGLGAGQTKIALTLCGAGDRTAPTPMADHSKPQRIFPLLSDGSPGW